MATIDELNRIKRWFLAVSIVLSFVAIALDIIYCIFHERIPLAHPYAISIYIIDLISIYYIIKYRKVYLYPDVDRDLDPRNKVFKMFFFVKSVIYTGIAIAMIIISIPAEYFIAVNFLIVVFNIFTGLMYIRHSLDPPPDVTEDEDNQV